MIVMSGIMQRFERHLQRAEEHLGYCFHNKTLLKGALIHPSLAQGAHHFQRLEFLGDRVCALLVSHNLFMCLEQKNEGILSKILSACVRTETLAHIARSLGFERHLQVKSRTQLSDSVLADALEAYVGAVFLDGGLEAAAAFINPYFTALVAQYVAEGDVKNEQHLRDCLRAQDPKSALQEWCAKNGRSLPHYELVGAEGSSHSPVFHIALTIDGQRFLSTAPNKKEAQRRAALLAIEHFGVG